MNRFISRDKLRFKSAAQAARQTHQYVVQWDAGDTEVIIDFVPGYDEDNRPSIYHVTVPSRTGDIGPLDTLVCPDLRQPLSVDSRTGNPTHVLCLGPHSVRGFGVWTQCADGVTLRFRWCDVTGTPQPRTSPTTAVVIVREFFI